MMRRRKSVVRKLSIGVIAIVTLVIAAVGLVNNILSHHYALESARAVLKFNSESILSGIDKLMMTRNNDGVLELIQDISKDSRVYRDIRLISHYPGEIVVSRLDAAGANLSEEDPSCAICHDQSGPLVPSEAALDEVVTAPSGTRILHVITPIMNKASCETGECHEHVDSGPILGFLEAEYSLGRIDTLTSDLNTSFVGAALAAILLGTIALWVMFKQTLGKPIRQMAAGIQAIAANDLTFRFKTDRNDEFGLVEESVDHMTARIQTHQDELRDAREYLEGIVENSADIIITVNPEGFIQTVNRGAEEALDYRREELIGQRIELLFADPRERDVAIARLEDQDSVVNYETRFLTKSKATRSVLLTLSRLRNREGMALGTIGISKDITKEKELQYLVVQLQSAAAIGQAATAVQHAIKNMLNTLTGGSYLVRLGIAKDSQERVREGIEMVDEGIATIGDLSSNILKYAKEWTLNREVTDLGLLVSDICRGIEQAGRQRGVRVHWDIPDRLPRVRCDPRLIRMALMDIATNALDACNSKSYTGTEIAEIVFALYLQSDDNSVVVEVRDNGIGMDAETKTNVFKPFFTTKELGGTGLGLALTSRIVKLHGGEVRVESEPQRGSRFRIVLPVEHMSMNQGAKDGQESPGG
jgi:PAS domain S-box-containing protein